MKKITSILQMALVTMAVTMSAFSLRAQDYDDDLYYSPSRAKAEAQARAAAAAAAAQAAGLGASDTYTTGSSNPISMDVDTYNRRDMTAKTAQYDGGTQGNFNYTHRIERFHNPNIVSASNDTTLMDYYYSTPTTQDINLYVINNVDPIGGYWGQPSYNYWNWYTPGFNFGWNSSFGWNWNFGWNYGWNYGWYDPFWSWGWNWGYRPWWGPYWGPGWTWGPSWAWYPPHHHPVTVPVRPGYDRPGASRPHAPSYAGTGSTYRPGSSNRPGNTGSYRPGGIPNNQRPGGFGYPTGNYRPGNSGQAAARPDIIGSSNGNHTGGTYTPTNNDRRGGTWSTGSSSSSSNRVSTPSQSTTRNSSGSSYRSNSGSSSSGRSSGGSYGGGGSRSGGSGSRGGGGGGSHRSR